LRKFLVYSGISLKKCLGW